MATRFYERHFQKSNNPQGFTFNELHEKLDKANKENLSLKTRIYLLEEDQGLLGKEDEENVYRINIDLKVRTQELLQELSEKDDVLKQALGTIHILRKHLYSTKLNRNVWFLPTVHCSGAKLFNMLPLQMRETKNPNTFKRLDMKKHPFISINFFIAVL